MKTISKVLSMVLLVAMCLSLMGGSAYADEGFDGNDLGSAIRNPGQSDSDGSSVELPADNGGGSGGNQDPSQSDSSDVELPADGGGGSDGSQNSNDSNNDSAGISMLSDEENSTQTTSVWTVGGNTGADTLHAALEKVTGPEATIKLNQNTTLTEYANISRSVTIDLGGNTLTLNSLPLQISNGAFVTLTNGTVVNKTGTEGNYSYYNIADVSNGSRLILTDITADKALFGDTGSVTVADCTFLVYDPGDLDNSSLGENTYVENGVVKYYEARIGNMYYKTVKEAISAATSGQTVECINPNNSVLKDFDAQKSGISQNINISVGNGNLNLDGSEIHSNVTVTGKQISGQVSVMNNASLSLSSGMTAGTISMARDGSTLYVNGATVSQVNIYDNKNNVTVVMSSGTIKNLASSAGSQPTLKISGGTVENAIFNGTNYPDAITGGLWYSINNLDAFDDAIASGYARFTSGTGYQVMPSSSSGGSSGSDSGVSYVVYGSPYTRNSSGSVYAVMSRNFDAFWVGTNSNGSNATKLTYGSQYNVSSSPVSGYSHSLNFYNSYLNSLANGTYYIFGQDTSTNTAYRLGSFVVQGTGTVVNSENPAVWPEKTTWNSGDGSYTFYVVPNLALQKGSQYNYYDVRLDNDGILSGDQFYYNGLQSFTLPASTMEKLAPGQHTMTVVTSNGTASCVFYVTNLRLRAVNTDRHVIGSSLDLTFYCTEPISYVDVGGVQVTDTYYSNGTSRQNVYINGNYVTLRAAWLNERTAGQTYTITAHTSDGRTASTTFRILTTAEAQGSPATGDESNVALWTAVLLVSGAGTAALLPRLKKGKQS